MAYSYFSFPNLIDDVDNPNPVVPPSVFRQVHSPSSIVHGLPQHTRTANSRARDTRTAAVVSSASMSAATSVSAAGVMPSVASSTSSNIGHHQSNLFVSPHTSSVLPGGDDFHLDMHHHGSSSGNTELPITRRLSRRRAPAVAQPNPVASPLPPPRPASPNPEDSESAKAILSQAMNKVWFERNAEKAYQLTKKEKLTHNLSELRKYLDHIDETEWLYTPIDQLTGQR